MADKADTVKHIWHMVYDMFYGPGRSQTIGSYMHLPPKFDNELLNNISSLSSVSGPEQKRRIEEVRTKVNICQGTGLIGANDAEKIMTELDKII